MRQNTPPTFVAGPSQRLPESSQPQTVSDWATAISPGAHADEAEQRVSFLVKVDPVDLFTVAGRPLLQPDGTLVFAPAFAASGKATVTVRAVDDGGTDDGGDDTGAPVTFTISVSPMNDPPSFVPGDGKTVLEDAGAQEAAWATSISPGPEDESGQRVEFVTTTDSPGLFASPPEIDAGGRLHYTFAPDANGTARVTTRATDDGGTLVGGRDESGAVTITLAATAVNDTPTFVAGGDRSALAGAPSQTVLGWASNIRAGPPDEMGQAVRFASSTSAPTMFDPAGLPHVGVDGTLTFKPAAGANGSATVTVRAVDDGGTANGGNDTSPPQSFTISITAINDPPVFTAGADQTVSEDAGAQTVAGWATGISAGPPEQSAQSVTFAVTSDNPALFSVAPAVAPDGTLQYTPAADANGSATVTVRAVDDGGSANGGNDTSPPQSFTISITAINDPPVFTAGADQTVSEDAGAQTVAGWATGISAGPPEQSAQSVTFAVTSDNPALFSVAPAVAPDGTLQYTPAADANGSATVTVRAVDDGGSANGGNDTSPPQSFTISITAINDPPVFTAGADQTVSEDAGAQTVAGWATGISAGPPEQSAQSVTFAVTSDNPALFSVAPAVAPDGTLQYTPAADANGSATVTVRAVDDGGSANGGNDTSPPQSFAIGVTPVNDAPAAIELRRLGRRGLSRLCVLSPFERERCRRRRPRRDRRHFQTDPRSAHGERRRQCHLHPVPKRVRSRRARRHDHGRQRRHDRDQRDHHDRPAA